MNRQPQHAKDEKTTMFRRWLDHNRAYGEVLERYAHPAKKR